MARLLFSLVLYHFSAISKVTQMTVLARMSLSLLLLALGSASAYSQGFQYLEVSVLDPDGKPLPEAEVQISMGGTRFPMYADNQGKISFNVPADSSSRLQIGVQMEEYLAQAAAWKEGEKVPENFKIQMKKGASIGGIVQDEEGNPIEDVLIEGIMISNGSTQLPGGGKLQPYFYGELARTDADGKWEVKSAPEHEIELQLKFSHPEYVSDRGYGFRGGRWADLRSLKKVVVMERGIILTGTVTDETGNPVVGAKLGVGSDYVQDEMIGRTDTEGKYRLNNATAGSQTLTVYADGYAPDMRTVILTKDSAPEDFQLGRGTPMKFRVVDPDGLPIPGVGIAADTWRGSRALMTLGSRGSTGADGTWTWENAPDDQVQIDLFCQGRMSVRGQYFVARDEPHEVVMDWPVELSGKVVDAETGVPIDMFQVVQGIQFEGNDRIYWQRHNLEAGHGGEYKVTFDEPRQASVIRVEAAGYRPAISRQISMDEGQIEINFELEAGSGPTGVVRLPSGEPAAGAEVAMASTGSNQIYISNGRTTRQNDTPSTTSDSEGRFELPFPEADFAVVAVHDFGWAQGSGEIDSDNLELTLQPWARVKGTARRGAEPRSSETVTLYQNQRYDQNRPYVYWQNNAVTDTTGHFSFDRVRAGEHSLALMVSYGNMGNGARMSTYSQTKPISVEAGETVTVDLGGSGTLVRGRLTIPEGKESLIDFNMGVVTLQENRVPTFQGGLGIFRAVGQAIAQGTAGFSRAGRASQSPSFARSNALPRSFSGTIAADGKFEIPDVMPGSYRATCTIYQIQAGGNYNWQPQATLNTPAEVPQGEETLDLGDLQITVMELQSTTSAGGNAYFIRVAPTPTQ